MSTDLSFPPKRQLEPAVPPPDERLSSDDAAAYLGASVATLRNWRSQKVGPAYYRLVGKVFYSQSDLDAWLCSRRVTHRR